MPKNSAFSSAVEDFFLDIPPHRTMVGTIGSTPRVKRAANARENAEAAGQIHQDRRRTPLSAIVNFAIVVIVVLAPFACLAGWVLAERRW